MSRHTTKTIFKIYFVFCVKKTYILDKAEGCIPVLLMNETTASSKWVLKDTSWNIHIPVLGII